MSSEDDYLPINCKGKIMKRLYLDLVAPLTPSQINERRSKVEHERTKFYVNRCPRDIYIRDRSGLLTQIKARLESSSFKRDLFYVCEQINCTPDVRQDYVHQARNTSNSMRQFAQKAVLTDWNGEPPVSTRYSVEAYSTMSLDVLEANEGVVYLEEHDIVVIYGLSEKDMEQIRHPYSLAGYTANSIKQIRQTNPYVRKGDFTFNIRIVDNYDQFGARWILIEDTPFCIIPSKDESVTDGIYVTYSKNMLNGDGPQKLMTDRFDFKDGANLPYYKLYESQQEALLARRGIVVDEANARIRELESKASTADANLRKAQHERDNMEREAQLKREKHEQDMEKLRRENEKLQKEHELYMQKQVGETLAVGRKNTTEIIKCVPVIISTIACTIALFRKKE